MQLIKPAIKPMRLLYLLLLPVLCCYPTSSVLADTVPTESVDQTTVVEPVTETPQETPTQTTTPTEETVAPQTGPTSPTGADGRTYSYNSDSGLWENDYYTWNPNTNQTAPKNAPNYSYNPNTGMWDTTDWRYDAPSGQYVPNVVSTTAAPLKSLGIMPLTMDGDGNGLGVISPSLLSKSSDPNSVYNLFYNAQISNLITSTAISGDANVLQNTLGGSALSGNAQALANIINLLQSSWSPATSGQIATFISNIDGNAIGDIVIDPSQIPIPPLSVNQAQPSGSLTVNSVESSGINNEIDLAAYSGDANVNLNTQAGDATSGDATAMANIINMINSIIGSGQSFIGTININGNLNGDILLPPDVLNSLLTSNSVPKTTIDTANIEGGSLLANLNNNQSINNNVNTYANSGNATVAGNTTAGNATSGGVNTNITLLNLTGQQVIGDNALLVFVNVLGTWVGMIMNAPEGATAAALGGNVSQAPCSCFADTEINSDSTQAINNNINVAAASGDATVSQNTLAGNATSGNATASVNLANFINSKFSLSNWFGVLFINVFGNWTGSFGVDTAAGNPIINNAQVQSLISDPANVQVFKFVSTINGSAGGKKVVAVNLNDESQNDNQTNTILASAVKKPGSGSTAQSKQSDSQANNWLKLSGLSLLVGVALMATSRLSRKQNQS